MVQSCTDLSIATPDVLANVMLSQELSFVHVSAGCAAETVGQKMPTQAVLITGPPTSSRKRGHAEVGIEQQSGQSQGAC